MRKKMICGINQCFDLRYHITMQEKVMHLANVRDIAQYALEEVMHFLQIFHMDQQTNEVFLFRFITISLKTLESFMTHRLASTQPSS